MKRFQNVSKCLKSESSILRSGAFERFLLMIHGKKLLLKKLFSLQWNLKEGFAGKCGFFRISYATLNPFVQYQIFKGFTAEPFKILYETIKNSYFPTKFFLKFRSEKQDFQQKPLYK